LLAYCRDPQRAPDKELLAEGSGRVTDMGQLVAQQEEIARLRSVVAGYERGRFIRLMKWVHETWERIREGSARDATRT
jgi:hypothetical protein